LASALAPGTDADPATAAIRRAKVRLENEFINSTPFWQESYQTSGKGPQTSFPKSILDGKNNRLSERQKLACAERAERPASG
jgi:hypothetical protein